MAEGGHSQARGSTWLTGNYLTRTTHETAPMAVGRGDPTCVSNGLVLEMFYTADEAFFFFFLRGVNK